MKAKRWLVLVLFATVCLFGLSIYWIYHTPIVEGEFNELVISTPGQKVRVIEDKEQIRNIIEQINTRSRSWHPQNGFRYDYLPHGVLTFKKGSEKVELGMVLPKGNVVTKYWEVETGFEMAEGLKKSR
ncbi:hypothetical protein ACQ0QQ_04915 [Lysinibacillus sphaericus]